MISLLQVCQILLTFDSTMAEPKKFKRVFFSAMTCVAIILGTVSNVCVYAFGEVTNGSITAFLVGKYANNQSIIFALMMANTTISLSVLFTYPIQLFPTFELIGPKVNRLWYKFRHGGRYQEGGNEVDETDLTGFDPMPTLHEDDVASLSSYNEHMYENNFESETEETPVRESGNSEGNLVILSSMISSITEAFPEMTIPGDSMFLRIGLVFLTYLVAVVIPNVQVLISLAGAIAGSSTALLIPPMLELALIDHLDSNLTEIQSSPTPRRVSQQNETSSFGRLFRFDLKGKFWKKKLKNFCLFWTGFVFMVIGAYASISDILRIWFSKGST